MQRICFTLGKKFHENMVNTPINRPSIKRHFPKSLKMVIIKLNHSNYK